MPWKERLKIFIFTEKSHKNSPLRRAFLRLDSKASEGYERGSGSNGTVNRLKDFLVWFMHPLQCAKAGVLHE